MANEIEKSAKRMNVGLCVLDPAGHLNPMLALSSQLMQRGHRVFFLLTTPMNIENIRISKKEFEEGKDYHFEKLWSEDDLRRLREDPTTFYQAVLPPKSSQDEHEIRVPELLLHSMVKSCVEQAPKFIEAVKRCEIDVLISDPILLNATIAAAQTDVPVVGVVTFPGFSSVPLWCGKDTEEERRDALESFKRAGVIANAARSLKQMYGIDFFENFLPSLHMLPKSLNLCTGIPEFDEELPAVAKEVMGSGIEETFLHVGPMVLSEEEGHIAVWSKEGKREQESDFPFDRVQKFKEEGRKVVYISFGSMVAGWLWDWEDVQYGRGKPFGARQSGKVFCTDLWQKFFEAFGGDDRIAVVLSSGPKFQDEKEFADHVPDNFIVRPNVPQVELLDHVDAFVTHAGANSMFESIAASVPMLATPYFADQFGNAKMISREGVGLHYDDPVAESSAEDLKEKVWSLLENKVEFVANCERLQRSIKTAGGAKRASEAIEAYVADFKGHGELKGPRQKEVLERCGSAASQSDAGSSLRSFELI